MRQRGEMAGSDDRMQKKAACTRCCCVEGEKNMAGPQRVARARYIRLQGSLASPRLLCVCVCLCESTGERVGRVNGLATVSGPPLWLRLRLLVSPARGMRELPPRARRSCAHARYIAGLDGLRTSCLVRVRPLLGRPQKTATPWFSVTRRRNERAVALRTETNDFGGCRNERAVYRGFRCARRVRIGGKRR